MKNKCLLSIPRGDARGLLAFILIGITLFAFVQGCENKKGNTDPPQVNAQEVAKPCGTFTCPTHKALPGDLGAEFKVEFQFHPSDCDKKDCRCEPIAYVQVARIVLRDGTYWDDGDRTPLIVKNETGEESLELNGWFIDTWLNAKYGYYARFKNGEFSTEYVGLGQNKESQVPAWLFDRPAGLPKDSLVEFIDAPVCLDTNATCKNMLLGFSHLWFTIGKDGNPPSIDGPAFDLEPKDKTLKNLKDAVRLAMNAWNDTAPSRGSEIEKFP